MTIYEKIAKIQDEVEVRKSADNPFFHSKYATYEGVLNAIHDAMRKYNLVAYHTFRASGRDGSVVVITKLVSWEDETDLGAETSELEIPLLKNDPQSAGSAITYAKRYSLLAILGLGTEDDDGNSSSGKDVKYKPIDGDVYDEAMKTTKCKRCGANMKFNPNTGKWYCEKKCWLSGSQPNINRAMDDERSNAWGTR